MARRGRAQEREEGHGRASGRWALTLDEAAAGVQPGGAGETAACGCGDGGEGVRVAATNGGDVVGEGEGAAVNREVSSVPG